MASNGVYRPPKSRYIPIRANGRVAFRFDPERGIVELKTQGDYLYIDLALEVEKAAVVDNPPLYSGG